MAERGTTDFHVIVKFGKGIPTDTQGVALLDFERRLRELMSGAWVEVFKETKPDDSRLRMLMTTEQRAKL